jgi:elongation factor 3
LDVAAVEWLANYVNSLKCTVCLVSHDYEFLDLVLTDVIHIADQKLTYYPGSFKDFQKLRPEIVAGLPSPASAIQRAKAEMAAAAAAGSGQEASSMHRSASSKSVGEAPAPDESALKTVKPLNFPDPGPLDGIKSRLKPVMSMKNVLFKYETAAKPILTDVNVRLSLTSRVALVGENGAGKTTLLKLLVGDLDATSGVGEVWKHHNLRVAYIAQHSMHHLEDHVESTPLAYIQDRFYLGRDKELAKLATLALDDEDKSLMTQRGEIEQIVGRAERGGKQLWYEVIKVGRKKDDTVWEPLEFLQKMKPYVMKLVRHYDETMKAMQSGVDTRPLTAEEVKKHLADFGLDEDLAVSKIRRFSGGQRSRLVLAAAMWNRPHLICLDEPTNYIDNALLAALTKALQQFRGGVITISHNEAFVAQLCTEKWHVGGGVVKMEVIGAKADILKAKEAARAARMSGTGAAGADEEDA